jgi:hypothetical protein
MVVVASNFYKKWEHSTNGYVVLRYSHLTYVHVSHVKIIKFPMLLTQHRVQDNDHVYLFPIKC